MRIKVGYPGFEGTLTLRESALEVRVPPVQDGSQPMFIQSAVEALPWDRDKEQVWVVLLNQRSKIKAIVQVSVGCMTSSVIHPREVFRPALMHMASAVVLVHNHPSGDPTPSVEDHQVTTRLVEAGVVLGIRLVDHVVLGHQQYRSFKDEGWIR